MHLTWIFFASTVHGTSGTDSVDNGTTEVLSTTTATTIAIVSTTQESFLCPDVDCDSPECHHLERSGLCEDVLNRIVEITRENCGCCFVCKDDIGESFSHKLFPKTVVTD